MKPLTLLLCVVAAALFFTSCQEKSEQKPADAQQAQSAAPGQTSPPAQLDPAAQTPTGRPAGQPDGAAPEAAPASQAPQSGEMVPLNITLPKPMFVGTPTNIAVPNLERPLGHPRPPFLAPAGTKNISLKKAVSSSDEQPIIGELAMITDGDREAAEGSFVELGPGTQHVTIDLKVKQTIYAVLVWHYHKQAAVYHDVIVQVADDKDFITNVQTVFNNDIDNSSGRGVGKDLSYVETSEGKLIDAKGVQGRYVRLFSRGNTGNDLNHYIEVEVYGKAVQ